MRAVEGNKNIKQRQKELKQQYKEMKPPMGIFIIRNRMNGKAFIHTSQNVESGLRRDKFQLEMGNETVTKNLCKTMQICIYV